jgi:hypothetical protein
MDNRRDLLALGGAATLAAFAGRGRAFAAPVGQTVSRLETRLFNFNEHLSPGVRDDIIAKFKDRVTSAAVVVGRNFIPTPFPTRFEWIYMARLDDAAGNATSTDQGFRRACDELASHCRNQVQCDLTGAGLAAFSGTAGVKVRHTVMFDFKPDAPPEARDRNVAAIRAMGNLPMVQKYLVQRNTQDASGPDQMQWQVIGDFASAADYRAYSEAPVHLAIRDDFIAHTARVAFLDVEL